MLGSRDWIRFARRWAAAAVVCGSAVGFGCGCQSTVPSGTPPESRPAPPTAAPPPREVTVWSAGAITPGPGHGVSQAGGIEPPAAGGPPPRLVADPPAAAGAAEPLDLGVALRLAGVENPTINLARERIQEALADQLAARVLLLPSVNVGGNYHYHAGPLQAGTGLIRNPDAQSLYLGFGAAAVGSGSVAVPGVRLFAHLGDGAFEPLAARRRVSARQSDAHAVQNDILLRVATGYLELVGAEARREVLIRGEAEVAEVVRLTRVFAEKGQGRQGDADRTATRADLVRRAERGAEEDVAVASARLCQLLSLDPSVRLRGPGGAVLPFRLIDEDADAEPLVAAALRARPEVAARAAEVSEAQVRVRQEKVRPLLPLVSVGYSGGLFGGGSNQVTPQFGALQGRSDLDVFAVWNVQGLGFGNRARVRQADAEMGQAIARYDATVNQVRDEVSEGLTDARAAARQLALAKAAVATAEDGFGLERLRIKEGQGRPIEALDSFQQLLDARQELVRAVIAFDVAQFRLFVAVGSTPGAELPAVGPDRR